MITNTEFKTLRKQVEDAFIALYGVDPASLSTPQKVMHQEALSAAYSAVVALENAQFDKLTNKARTLLNGLQSSTEQLQKKLAGLKKAAQVIKIATSFLNVFTSLAKLT